MMGDTQRSQKTKLDDKPLPRLITSLDELTLNPKNSGQNANLSKPQGSERIQEVTTQGLFSLVFILPIIAVI